MSGFLTAAAVMLGGAVLFVILFRRLGLGATLGYIVSGAILGPYALNLVGEAETIQSVAEIGIALLLFIVGLELQPSRLWRLRHDIFGLGLLQVTIAGLALALLIHWTLEFSWEASLALGLPLALSSTAQVLPMLRSTGELNTPYGERAFSILLFQDLSIIPLITIIAAMSRSPDPEAVGGWQLVLFTVLAVAGLVVAGRFLLNPLFRLIGRFNERELFVVAGLFAAVGSAALMHYLHLSVALGAFVAGVMLAESPYRHELESDVEPFRSILLGLFFMSVGMMLDLSVIASRPLMVLGLAIMVIAVKAAVLYPLARWFKMRPGRSISIALLLSQAGEFGFVLFSQATAAQLISPEAASLFGAVVTLSMVSTPFLMMLIEYLQRRRPEQHSDLEGPEFSPETNAIVVGYGRFGQTVAQMLYAKRIPVTLIDSNARQIERVGEFGHKVYYGDGTRIDLLRTAGAETAEAILFCHDDRSFSRDKLEAVLEAFPQAKVMVRVFDRIEEIALDGLDVDLIQREVFESAMTMGSAALQALRVADREVVRVEREFRVRDSDRLHAQSQTGDLHAGAERSFAADRGLPDEPADPAKSCG
ncbi:monovalent cation:proton antiporter-2 (CPA2) family protein [Sphingomonas alba]|uniref:Monovalent cation:proton antiporter-2 (CPA2) family protein n=1 Tax=Sphingomonas alba TaxID=2908208 RepID=A0ABT0RP01_9SPHN|nr:monovalent cation:proton antiporter-2 (CPA2) family protein [Sphingomonas alba]MCL6684325.1 monovalent cation:proton antiporter-2 (CPA2) family protein [Sphingomonas alba]